MSKKLHILFTIPNFDTSGSGKVVYDLANQLDKNRFKVSIACRHDKGIYFKQIESLGLPIHFVDTTVSLRPYFTLIQRLQPFKTLLKKEEVDVVHSWHWSSNWSEVLACRLTGVTFVYTKKSMSWGNIHWKIKSYLSNFIITVNPDMKAFFPCKKKQRLIPFGVDINAYQPELFTNITNEQKFKIITVANLVPVKNIEILIQALHKIKHLPLHLDIVGDTRDSYSRDLKRMVTDLGLDTHISFLGFHSDVRPLLVQSDLYVISSKKEGMPMALLEAMIMAVPVLGSNISGISFLLRDFNDLLFDVDDHETLAMKIENMIFMDTKLRKKLGYKLRQYVIENFSMRTYLETHEGIYSYLKKHNINKLI